MVCYLKKYKTLKIELRVYLSHRNNKRLLIESMFENNFDI
jgi:hypothetical protein